MIDRYLGALWKGIGYNANRHIFVSICISPMAESTFHLWPMHPRLMNLALHSTREISTLLFFFFFLFLYLFIYFFFFWIVFSPPGNYLPRFWIVL
ncbi:hypothetical protein CPSG_05045 [Coccidioides posadasii str. Silveira]|uniref:Uncharacterized protein n=1 Tax=Coccidioides posadasii (strain RMSCC 757 / Silveira) TaxID=443226 RepID=E9D615_COCPS|nr:hypothetical protein CPSG_05045 [Coccidioides posadasii str. Silveira]